MPDGSRDFATTSYRKGNLCLSEPETAVEFVKLLRMLFDRNPNLMELSVAPNDVWVPCMCERCLGTLEPDLREQVRREAGLSEERGTARLSLSPDLMREFRAASGRLLAEFHVAVARELHQSHPDRLVGTFGGYESYGAPENYARLADLPPNLAFCITKTRSDFWDEDYRQQVRETVRGLREITPHIYAWEYYLWNGRPWRQRPQLAGYPVFFPSLLAEDIRFMHEHGLRGEYANSWGMAHKQPGLDHPMAYLTGRMLFDPTLEMETLLEEYYTLFYGPARDAMKAFWEHAETCWLRDTGGLDTRSQVDEIVETLYPPEDLGILFAHLDEAKARVPEGSREFRRIALIGEEMAVNRSRLATGLDIVWDDWTFRKDPDNRGMDEGWFGETAGRDGNWQPVEVPAFLAQTTIGPYLGYGWYATGFTVPEAYRGRDLHIAFGAVDEQAWVFLNGQLVGEHSTASTGLPPEALWNRPFTLPLPARILAAEGNRLVVRKHSSRNNAGIWQPVRLFVPGADHRRPPQLHSLAIFPAPAIDGSYQAHWGGATLHLLDREGKAAIPATLAKVAHDPQHLYFTFRAEEDGTAPLPAERDGTSWHWRDGFGYHRPRGASNTFEIQLRPDPEQEAFAQILINAGGGVFDAFYHHPDHANPADWNSGAAVQVQLAEHVWTATIAIPWESLGLRLRPGLEIKANLFRTRAEAGTTAWSPAPPTWDSNAIWQRGRDVHGSLAFLEE